MSLRPVAVMLTVLVFGGCSRSNNVLLGRVESDMGGHRITVADCYRFFGIPEVQKLGEAYYRYAPCKDNVVVIQADSLYVNGTPYGNLAAGDSVTVDKGKVLINGTRQ